MTESFSLILLYFWNLEGSRDLASAVKPALNYSLDNISYSHGYYYQHVASCGFGAVGRRSRHRT